MTLIERLRSANVELWTVGVRGAMNVLVDPRPLLDEAATALATAEQQLVEARRLLGEWLNDPNGLRPPERVAATHTFLKAHK